MPTLPAFTRSWKIVATASAALALIAWGLFRPEFRPDPSTLSPTIRQELAKTGFASTRGVRAVRLESTESIAGLTDNWTTEQQIHPIDGLITQKRTWRRGIGMAEEIVGLYVGPLSVVRFHRTKPPIIGDLLPSLFWSSSRMSTFVLEESSNFPGTKGGTMRARVTYEDRYADGQLLQTENRRLQCVVADLIDAAVITSGLSGSAARIECREVLEPNGRKVGRANPQTWSQESLTYAHWYVITHRWSIPAQGQTNFRISGGDEIGTWKSKVVSFEMTGD